MGKLILSFLGLPGSGKTSVSERVAQEHGFRHIKDIGADVSYQLRCKTGLDAPFEFDNKVFMKSREVAQEILNSKDKKVIFEAGPPMAQMYVRARAELGKHKEPRRSLLQAYDHHSINQLMENTVYIYLFMPPQIAISRQEEKSNQQLDSLNIDFIHLMHKSLMDFYKAHKDRVILVDVVGKTEDQIYKEVERKVLALVAKEAN